ncbi:MAG: nitroreductase [Pseudomonadota bacterium]
MTLTTDPTPTVSDALRTRITVRDFLDTPVPEDTLRAILDTALRSPSGGNLQPWNIHVMQGGTLARFTTLAMKRTLRGDQEEPTYRAYPSPLWEPHRSWRYKLGEDMYALLGIPRDDKPGRLRWFAENARFFGAPVGLIFTGDKRLEMPQHMDIGILLESIMLLAREHGLHTAPQGWWRNWTSVCHEVLDIAEGQHVLVGMALGYANPDAPVNDLYADRAPLSDVATFYD